MFSLPELGEDMRGNIYSDPTSRTSSSACPQGFMLYSFYFIFLPFAIEEGFIEKRRQRLSLLFGGRT